MWEAPSVSCNAVLGIALLPYPCPCKDFCGFQIGCRSLGLTAISLCYKFYISYQLVLFLYYRYVLHSDVPMNDLLHIQ